MLSGEAGMCSKLIFWLAEFVPLASVRILHVCGSIALLVVLLSARNVAAGEKQPFDSMLMELPLLTLRNIISSEEQSLDIAHRPLADH